VTTLPSGAGLREEGVTFTSEEPAQAHEGSMPVSPAPTNQIQAEDEVVARPIAAPEAAKPRKAGSAKGKDATGDAIESPKGGKSEKGRKPKAKEPTVKSPKRKTKTGR
jgi:hypothetical protein